MYSKTTPCVLEHTRSAKTELHPRPQFQRKDWTSLNGEWRFCFDNDKHFCEPKDIHGWPLKIQVPFAPETLKSGINDTKYHRVCWYERDFNCQKPRDGRLLLHFGAV